MNCGSKTAILVRLLARAALFWLLASSLMPAQELRLSWNGKELRVFSPKFRFLTGKPAEAARNGRTVAFDFQLSVLSVNGVLKRAVERFAISYDLWEEKYAVNRLGVRRQQTNLTQEAAEAWCLDNLALDTVNLSPDRPVTIMLEVRSDHARDGAPVVGDPGISLTALIELFSRPARSQQQKWTLQNGPVRLNDVKASDGGKGL